MDSCDKKEIFERVAEWSNRPDFYAQASGIRITRLWEGGGSGEMEAGPEKLNPNGTIHGGALFTLADTVAGVTAAAMAMARSGSGPEQLSCATVSGSLNYLRPTRCGRLSCTALCRKAGSALAVMDVSIRDQEGTETCSGTFTMYYIDKVRYMTEVQGK